MQHLSERKKELKRRRKKRRENVNNQQKEFKREDEPKGLNIKITAGYSKDDPRLPENMDWSRVADLDSLLNALPEKIKPKRVWTYMPGHLNHLKQQVLQMATDLISSRSFAAPNEWDGSLKMAIVLIRRKRLPNGFRNFLGI